MATSYRHHGLLEKERGGQTTTAIAWHVRALEIWIGRGEVAQGIFDLRRLSEYRRELGTGQFTSLLNDASGYPDLADGITVLIDQMDQLDKSEGGTD